MQETTATLTKASLIKRPKTREQKIIIVSEGLEYKDETLYTTDMLADALDRSPLDLKVSFNRFHKFLKPLYMCRVLNGKEMDEYLSGFSEEKRKKLAYEASWEEENLILWNRTGAELLMLLCSEWDTKILFTV